MCFQRNRTVVRTETKLQRRERPPPPPLCSRKEQGWNAAAAWPLTLQPGAVNVVALLLGKSTGNYVERLGTLRG